MFEFLFLNLLRPLSKGVIKALSSYTNRENKVPRWAFYSLLHVVPHSAFELLIVRDNANGPEVFLTERPPNDPEWPNAWHFPGTIIRIKDTFNTIKLRLAKDELGLSKLPGETKLLTILIDEDKPRGRAIHQFHVLHVDQTFENASGRFFPLSALPENMIPFQKTQLAEITEQIKTSS